jgi:putative ABC transport system permease protein
MLGDLRYAVRTLRKTPAFTFAALLALMLGIGANTAIFSVVYSVLLRPLPYHQPERLVWVWETEPDLPLAPSTGPDFLDWRQQNRVFQDLAAHTQASLTLTGIDTPQQLRGAAISARFFQTLGVSPLIGRHFRDEEDQPDRNNVAILGYGLWDRVFGADKAVLGRSIILDGRSTTIVGVMPRDFVPFPRADIWVPIAIRPGVNRGQHYLWAVGRLKPGVTVRQAQAEMETIARRLTETYPETNTGIGVKVIPLHEQFVGRARPTLIALAGAVAFVLLVACANVANLLLARSTVRRKELAVRAALGAGRWRLVRQLLTESLVLAVIGGGLGLLLALGGVGLLRLIPGTDIPRLSEVTVDVQVLLFTLGVSLLTGVAFGLVPALQLSGSGLNAALGEGQRTGAHAAGRRRVRSGLVVAEVALALSLSVASGLMVKSFLRVTAVDVGFRQENVLTAAISLPGTRYPEAQDRERFFQNLTERLRALPGVEVAGATSKLPILGGNNGSVIVEGQPLPKGNLEGPLVEFSAVNPGYFRAMGIAVRGGRVFTDNDTADSPTVAVINETMARKFWPGQEAVGRRFSRDKNPPRWIEVVGVVADVRQHGIERVPLPESYHPFTQNPRSMRYMVLRCAMDPSSLIPAVRRTVAGLDKDLPAYDVRTMEEVFATRTAPRRFQMLLFAVFAAVALLLASAGIYGVMAYGVSQRRHEIGVRLALGARTRDVLRMVMGEGLVLGLGGVVIGLVGSLALARVMSSLLFGVEARDPGTFLLVAPLSIVVALAASYLPARRAARVDPVVVLRAE